MKRIKIQNLIKIGLLLFLFALLAISGKNLYSLLSRAKKIDGKLVESYYQEPSIRPVLDLSLIKKAAGLLKKD